MGAVVISFFAGTLSVLSPCVLPLLPIAVASALQRHRHGPLALAAGLVLAAAVTGLAFASLGFVAGVDRDLARMAAAVFMVLAGLVLLVPRLQEAAARAAAPLARGASALTGRLSPGLGGQFTLGLLLGAVWTPCTGPTLAAAASLAARSENLARAGIVMLSFALGAVVPVLVVAYGARRLLAAREVSVARVAAIGKPAMGVLLLAVGALAASGGDKVVEAWLVERMPSWLVDLTTWL